MQGGLRFPENVMASGFLTGQRMQLFFRSRVTISRPGIRILLFLPAAEGSRSIRIHNKMQLKLHTFRGCWHQVDPRLEPRRLLCIGPKTGLVNDNFSISIPTFMVTMPLGLRRAWGAPGKAGWNRDGKWCQQLPGYAAVVLCTRILSTLHSCSRS